MSNLEYKNIFSVINDYDIFCFDIWGVIGEEKAYSGVAETINKLASLNKKIYFISNAPRLKENTCVKLEKWGVTLSHDQMITSGEVFRELIRNSIASLGIEKPIIYHLGSDRNEEIAANLPCILTNDIKDANIFLLSLYRDEGEDLNEFDDILKEAIALDKIIICANPDVVVPHEGVRYCSGYFAKKVEFFGGVVIYTGKPYADIFNLILTQNPNIDKKRVLMIGDTFETDILGANRVGISSALVLTGNAKRFYKQEDTIATKLNNLQKESKVSNIIYDFAIELAIIN